MISFNCVNKKMLQKYKFNSKHIVLAPLFIICSEEKATVNTLFGLREFLGGFLDLVT